MDNTNNTGFNARASVDLVNVWQEKSRQIDSPPALLPHQEHRLFKRFASLHRKLTAQPRKFRRQLARKARLSLADIAFMLALGFSLPAEAQNILVDINIPDPNPDGSCSLIEAINNANADSQVHRDCPAGSGDDTIILQSGSTHTITKSINRRPDQGLTAITSRMTIEGNDSTINVSAVPVDIVFNMGANGDLTLNDTTISGDAGSGSGTNGPRILNNGMLQLNNVQVLLNPDRVSAITNGSRGTLHADGLDVDCTGDCTYSEPTGNGIVNQGDMTLTNARVSNLNLGYGGGRDAVYNSGSMTINNVLVEYNSSVNYYDNSGIVNAGHLTGTDVTVSRNYSLLGRCGIVNRPGATLKLEDSLVADGSSSTTYRYCTQFLNEGTAYLNRVTNNRGYSPVNTGRMVITGSRFNGFSNSGDLELNSSTISGSSGVFIGNKATITNSTITGNTNVIYGRYDIYGSGSAVKFTGDITITNSTLGGNRLIAASNYLFSDVSRVSGILFDGNVSLSNSVITGSTLWETFDPYSSYVPAYLEFINIGVLTSHNNLIGDNSLTNTEAFTGFTPGSTDITATSDGTDPTPLANILDVEPNYSGQLIPRLADNGGPTLTVALVEGSPAIDAADNTACPSTDQRGIMRPQGAACDMGAFELRAEEPPVVPAISSGVATANHSWTNIAVDDMPSDAVVIAAPPSFNGGDPGVARIGHVGPYGFDIRFQEWDYRDGWHTTEQIPYLVVQEGRHVMSDGSVWEAGRFSHSGTPNWSTRSFTESFPGTPQLFLTIQAEGAKHTVTARARNVSSSGFEIGFFEQESLMDGHPNEILGYLAIYNPSGTGSIDIDGASVSYGLRQTSINHNWTTVLDKQIKVEEEQSKDAETWHAFESIDVMDLGGSLFGQIVTSNGGDPAALRQKD